MAAGNLLWEMAHVPLYTLWITHSWSSITYAVLHCTVGDVMIASVCMLLSLALVGSAFWPAERYRAVAAATILLALGYTVFSEWLNTEVRGTWAYRDAMPRLPGLGTGLTPLMQWIFVPVLAFWWAKQKEIRE
jgi:uncharacterized membrane protein YqjE